MPVAARRPDPAPPAADRRRVWTWAAAVLVVLALAAAIGLPLRDRAALNAARRAFLEHGERPPAPPAESGKTRQVQEAW